MISKHPTMSPDEIQSIFAESLHTGFRKGIDCEQAHPIWELISDMNPDDWGEYVSWVLWALDVSGLELVEKRGTPAT